jgi:lysophospholipid acyltransferase
MGHTLLATIYTYLFIHYFGRKKSAFWILGITVGHLCIVHIHRLLTDYGGWQLEGTTIYMMSICKFSSLAFSYEDGGKAELKGRYFMEK